jgi:hypothetical protein
MATPKNGWACGKASQLSRGIAIEIADGLSAPVEVTYASRVGRRRDEFSSIRSPTIEV